ncbi:MAG: sugar ABC transporter ATP-binding protein [Spirochaetales bacterium]|nr:sugar ABC transporter ATP-binding protein [Spirochaetales bacterium]
MKGEKLLELVEITKDYAGTRALDSVSFDLYSGEVHCLVGENGAGKSTLIKILSGAVRPTRGTIVLGDSRYSHLSPRDSINRRIATIYQDFDLIPTLSVADNIFLGDEMVSPYRTVERKKQVAVTNGLLEELKLPFDGRTLVAQLSPAQKQMLQLAKALHRDADIIIMDEPTSSLGYEETGSLMKLVRRLVEAGRAGIIYISHFLNEVFEVGDRITVLKDGREVATHRRGEFDSEQIIREMVGRSASMFYQKVQAKIGKPVVTATDFTWGDFVRHVSFTVHEGEIFGIGGLVGSGRTELATLLFGAQKADSGRLELLGREITSSSPRAAIASGISMISENRQEEGLFLIRPIRENIAVVHTERAGLLIKLKAEAGLVGRMMDRFRINASAAQEVRELSGGNQQKAIMSRWFLSDADFYIFDEPTKGVDIGAKEEIYGFMSDLAGKGKAIIMISSDMPELLSMSDRIGIMRDGEMVNIVSAREMDEPGLLKQFLGIES